MTLQRGNGLAKRRQAAALLKSGAMTIAAGTKLGRYEIRSKIGAGGMGEVYLAQETKLDRKVALKILPADLAAYQDRMRRFVQEARAAAVYMYARQFDAAVEQAKKTYDLDPNCFGGQSLLCKTYNAKGMYAEPLAQHKKTIDLDPGFARAHRTLAEVYRVKGDYANAVEERAKFFDLIGQPQNAALIRATFAKDGWLGFLRLVTAENSPLKDSNNNWVVAKAYVDLGQKDKAFAELNSI